MSGTLYLALCNLELKIRKGDDDDDDDEEEERQKFSTKQLIKPSLSTKSPSLSEKFYKFSFGWK